MAQREECAAVDPGGHEVEPQLGVEITLKKKNKLKKIFLKLVMSTNLKIFFF